MLEHIFGSKVRVKLLKLFLSQEDDKDYYVRELSRVLGTHLNSIRRELDNLEKVGLVGSIEKDKKKYYSVNHDFILLPELKALLLKSHELNEQKLISNIEKTGSIDLLVLSGLFIGKSDSSVDIFIVGKVQKPKIEKLLKLHFNESGKDLKYTIMN
jgi:hypothetical protein